MGRRDNSDGGRFGRSAHTSHGPREAGAPPMPPPSTQSSIPSAPARAADHRSVSEVDAYGPTSYIPVTPPQGPGDTRELPPPAPVAPNPDVPAPAAAGKVTVTRAVAYRGRQAAQTVTRKVVAHSRADGAQESGLTQLIWNQVLSFGSDAMVTVALAGTVFFSAAHSEQKGNVLGYLLITMAPFAIVAPVIGPVLDRLQHGRRWAMAGTAFGRAVLAILMAENFTNLFLLFPLALGSLVLSKAYSVVRGAAAPRVVPPEMSLVTANSRLSIFGLCAAIIGGGFVAAVVKITGSYPLGLWVAAIAFGVTGYFALRLPAQVDSAHSSRRHPDEAPRPARVGAVPRLSRIREWVSRGFAPQVIIAMQGGSLLRWTSGFLTIFLAFYIERTSHGFDAALALGAVGAGVGIGNFVGTAAGARFKLAHPEHLVLGCTAVAAVMCVFAAATFSLATATICIAVCSACNALGKLSLDAVIQRDVSEMLRSSAFGRSETFLQLAWVFGATVALLLPSNHGTTGLGVAAGFVGILTIVTGLHARALPKRSGPTVGQSSEPNVARNVEPDSSPNGGPTPGTV